ncbi:MAG TPA: response regulator [Verrucomicrobiae bacterium]|jgi:CheY-like chemotaxis protein
MGRTVLALEDDENDVSLLEREFRRGKIRGLHIVRNASEAQKYLAGIAPYENRTQNPFPDVLLLDLSLPGMSGLSFLEWLRAQADPKLRNLPVIVTSVSKYGPDIKESKRLHAIAYVNKPIKWQEVSSILEWSRQAQLPRGPFPAETGHGPSAMH